MIRIMHGILPLQVILDLFAQINIGEPVNDDDSTVAKLQRLFADAGITSIPPGRKPTGTELSVGSLREIPGLPQLWALWKFSCAIREQKASLEKALEVAEETLRKAEEGMGASYDMEILSPLIQTRKEAREKLGQFQAETREIQSQYVVTSFLFHTALKSSFSQLEGRRGIDVFEDELLVAYPL